MKELTVDVLLMITFVLLTAG